MNPKAIRWLGAAGAVAGLSVLRLALPQQAGFLEDGGLLVVAATVVASAVLRGVWAVRTAFAAVAAVMILLALVPFDLAGWLDLVALTLGTWTVLLHWFITRFTDDSTGPAWPQEALRFGLRRIMYVGALLMLVAMVLVALPWLTAPVWGARWGASADSRSLAASGLVVMGVLVLVGLRALLQGGTRVEADPSTQSGIDP